jgi:hypothetical protein
MLRFIGNIKQRDMCDKETEDNRGLLFTPFRDSSDAPGLCRESRQRATVASCRHTMAQFMITYPGLETREDQQARVYTSGMASVRA